MTLEGVKAIFVPKVKNLIDFTFNSFAGFIPKGEEIEWNKSHFTNEEYSKIQNNGLHPINQVLYNKGIE